MITRKRVVITNSKEIYNKLGMLIFNNNVVLKGVKERQIDKILENINRKNNILIKEKIGDNFLLKKCGPINFNVYYRPK
jgi:hypothetical protein